MEIRTALKEEVNSAFISAGNHDDDNGFFEDTISAFERELRKRGYEPLGICKNVPYPCAVASQSVAFVYRYDGEIFWCHMPETYWFHLLKQCYGYDEADRIVDRIMR